MTAWIATGLCACGLAAQGIAAAEEKPPCARPLAGAIRWDAWYGGDGEVEHAMERTLGPAKYHDRLPWKSRQAFRGAIDAFRHAVIQSGRKNPYIVCMDFSPQRAKELSRSLGLDAISAYACPGGSEAGDSFADSRQKVRAFWESCRTTGMMQVPLVSFGWDPRPRVDNPVPWTKYTSGNHYRAAEPQQLAEHLKEALDWTAIHPAATEANTVLIYAWNENDEGGWLVPTLNPEGGANTARVAAVGRMLNDWQARPGTAKAEKR